MRGQRVCKMHGGKSRGAVERAEQREAEAKAEAAIAELVPLLAAATPASDPIDMLARMLTVLEQMHDRVAVRVNELQGRVATGKDLAQVRAEAVLLERLQERIVRGAGKLADLGIAERHVELEQERAQLVTSAFLAALGVVSLLPADRDAMLRAFLVGIGRGPEVLEQGGGASS